MASYNTEEEDELDLLQQTPASDESRDLIQTKEKLLLLKRQMEEYERRERELENLKQRRHEVLFGQKHMREKLTRALTILERAEYDTRREVEQIQIARQNYSEHLQQLEEINPNEWHAEDMEEELNKSVSMIEHARTIYEQSRARISALNGQDFEQGIEEVQDGAMFGASNTFLDMLLKGFAFTLPILIALAILIAVLLARG